MSSKEIIQFLLNVNLADFISDIKLGFIITVQMKRQIIRWFAEQMLDSLFDITSLSNDTLTNQIDRIPALGWHIITMARRLKFKFISDLNELFVIQHLNGEKYLCKICKRESYRLIFIA